MAELLFYCQLIKAEHTFQRFLRHRFSTAAAWEKLIFTLHLCMKRGNASSKTPENGNFADFQVRKKQIISSKTAGGKLVKLPLESPCREFPE